MIEDTPIYKRKNIRRFDIATLYAKIGIAGIIGDDKKMSGRLGDALSAKTAAYDA